VKVVAEGKQEAKTYDTFACFCKNTSEKKTTEIAELETAKTEQKASLEAEEVKRDDADDKIKDEADKIKDANTELNKLKAARKKAQMKYDIEITDVQGAIKALELAIPALKNSDLSNESLLQVKTTVKESMMLARAMNINADAMSEQNVSDYDFQSGGIIGTLEGLLKDFKETRDKVDKDEVSAKKQNTMEQQQETQKLNAAKTEKKRQEGLKSKARAAIGQLMKDLTQTSADLADSQTYLLDLTNKCNSKKAHWDQRTQVRTEELHAITSAVTIIKTQVLQHQDTRRKEKDGKREKKNDKKWNAAEQKKEANSFVQVKQVSIHAVKPAKKAFLSVRDPRDRLLELINSKASILKSAVLTSLASKVQKDPLAKVKTLIEELVLRLQKEASAEESHNGWCNEQTTLATDKRDNQAQIVAETNTKLSELEIRRDDLEEKIKTLTDEIAALTDSQQKAKEVHEEEVRELQQAHDDAELGLGALRSAVEALDKFYGKQKDVLDGGREDGQIEKTSKDEEGHKAQEFTNASESRADTPDAGFEGDYNGDEETASGIYGLLEVIESDFQKTISASNNEITTSKAEFTKFEAETNRSIQSKTISKTDHETSLSDTNQNITDANTKLDESMKALESAVTELLELHEACVAGGDSYADRKAKREDEIAALREALEILDNHDSVN